MKVNDGREKGRLNIEAFDMVPGYRDLLVWQKSMDLVTKVYSLTAMFPASERFGLTNQLRRASVSVPSNIAEGQGRGDGQAFVNHLRIAKGSMQEVETQIEIAVRLDFILEAQAIEFLDKSCEVTRLISGLLRSVGKNR